MAVDGNRKRVQYEFLPRDAMLARYLLLSQLCRSVRPSQVGIRSKRLDESSWFWHGGFFPLVLHCVMRKRVQYEWQTARRISNHSRII